MTASKPQKVLLVDGNALLYRAYHAFPKELTTPQGEPVGAVYGFARILLSTIKTLKPDQVAVAFDLRGGTFRNELFDQYKATRQKMPDDLVSQINRMYQIVEFLEFPIYTAQGYEADDVIGALAQQATKEKGTQVIILTGDQDIIQLVTDQISVYSPGTFPKTPIMYTPEKVREKYGFSPKQMIEYKALRGDPSDNIPGIPGVGEVTATKLIEEFGTIEHLYKQIEAGQAQSLKPALREKIIQNKESAFLSHQLATILTDIPVKFDPDACRMELQNPDRLIGLFRELGFKSLMNELPKSHKLLSEATDVFTSAEEAKETPKSALPTAPLPLAETTPDQPMSESEKIDQLLEPTLRKMEATGVKVDCDYLKDLEKEFTEELASIKAKLTDLAGEEFNPDSPQQVSHILYEVLGIPTKNIRKSKNGYTTDAATLSELEKDYPIASILLHHRELMKLLTTYVRPLQQLVDAKDRIHTSYAPDTVSGRISSRNPNLQNIPVRSEQGKRLRKAFIASKGKILLAADYSQIELRVAAHLANDPVMKDVFLKGGDFHTETANRMNVDRRVAKIINFSILYGKGPFGFAVDMGITVPEAKKYIEDYFATYKQLRHYLDGILDEGRRNGYLTTMFGRVRLFPNLTSSNFHLRAAAEREALNLPIQGTAADILKRAMYNLAGKLEETKNTADMILTVHDELVLEVENKPKAIQETARLLQETMTNSTTLSVPLEVHLKTGMNWAEMEDLVLPQSDGA